MIGKFKTRANHLRDALESTENLAGGVFILKSDGRSAFTRGNVTDHRQFMGCLLPQNAGLEIEEGAESERQHHCGDRHDHKRNFFRDGLIAKPGHGSPDYRGKLVKAIFTPF